VRKTLFQTSPGTGRKMIVSLKNYASFDCLSMSPELLVYMRWRSKG
jgi:hypothetical protein